MAPVVDLLIPAVLVLLMLVVGMGLDRGELVLLRNKKRIVLWATLAQVLLLPPAAAGLVLALDPDPHIGIGLVLLAACPGGALSNYYSHLSRANVALSVALTSSGSLASLVTLPVAASIGLALIAQGGQRVEVPVRQILLQLCLLVLLPVALGMVCRMRWPERSARFLPVLNRLGLLTLLALIAFILADQAGTLSGKIYSVMALTVSFTLLSAALGAGLGVLMQLQRTDVMTLALEFSVRNLAIMALVAVTIFDRPEYFLFGALFFVMQTPLVLFAIWLMHRRPGGSAHKPPPQMNE